MTGLIERGGKRVRPMFNFSEHEAYPYDAITAQMSESSRNLQELILAALQRIESQLIMANQTLRRMDRRLATRMPLKKGRR